MVVVSQTLSRTTRSEHQTDLLPSLLKYNVKDSIRELIALPPRLGGMGIINPVEAAEDQHRNSVQLTDSLSKLIIEQDAMGEVDHSQIMIVKQEISKARDVQQKIRLAKIETGSVLTMKEKKKTEDESRKGGIKLVNHTPTQRYRIQFEQAGIPRCSSIKILLTSTWYTRSLCMWK